MSNIKENTKLQALEKWFNDTLKPDEIEVQLTSFIEPKILSTLKKDPSLQSLFKDLRSAGTLGFIKYRTKFDTYFIDVSLERFIGWYNKIPGLQAKWPTISDMIHEIQEYSDGTNNLPLSIEAKMDMMVEYLHKTNTYYLHKIAYFKTPDAWANFSVSEKYFTSCDTERIETLSALLPCCYGLHNGRIVLNYNGYYVGATPNDLAERFCEVVTHKKGLFEVPIKGPEKNMLVKDLYNFASICDQLLLSKIGLDFQYRPNYIFFNKVEVPSADNEIVKRITQYYNEDIKGIDLRTNTPLAESYFILVGWLFAPIDIKQRLVGCFECKTSNIGKTSFIKCLCDKVDVVFGTISQVNGSANQFSFSSCFANGPDIVNVDDPCKGTLDIMNYVGNVVSNKEAQVELKGENRYMLRNLDTRIYVSTNVPIYMKNDTTNFMTTKLFVLKANETLPDEGRSSKICEYITGCNKTVVEEFLSYCVQQYEKYGSEFIKSHMGIYIDKEEEQNLFEDMLDYTLVREALIGKTTLIECVRTDMHRMDHDIEHNDVVLKCWNMLCKHIQTQWPEIAKETVCMAPRNNHVYPIGNRPCKSRYKNYIITQLMQDKLLELLHLDSGDSSVTGIYNYMLNMDDVF